MQSSVPKPATWGFRLPTLHRWWLRATSALLKRIVHSLISDGFLSMDIATHSVFDWANFVVGESFYALETRGNAFVTWPDSEHTIIAWAC
jgi:hypothetical protein